MLIAFQAWAAAEFELDEGLGKKRKCASAKILAL